MTPSWFLEQLEATKAISLGFIAEPKDLDGTISFLASNKASAYITGSCITVDGGISWGG
jgi:NAD(P)-dependent dehydrogenase (short-subunit alcohol dehydrogenase family)